MPSKQQIRALEQSVKSYRTPVLSLYTAVNLGVHGTRTQAVLLRAKETMHKLDVPPAVVTRVLDRLEPTLGRTRSTVVFANADELDLLEFDVDLPIIDPTTGHTEARWGKPYLAPLLMALSRNEPSGVVFVDKQRWRLFEVYLGRIQELDSSERQRFPVEADQAEQPKRVHPGYVPGDDSGVRDRQEHHQMTWVKRFMRHMAQKTESWVHKREVTQVVLMGPKQDLHLLENELPESVRKRVVAHLSSMPNPDASAGEVLNKVTPTLVELEQAKQLNLLDTMRENSTRGMVSCLTALQEGRLQTLVVPWPMGDLPLSRDPSGVVTLNQVNPMNGHDGSNGNGHPRLKDILPELALDFGTRLEFMEGDHRDQLIREFGGMAGLPRW